MQLPLTGGCLCGNVRYEIIEKPSRMGICHCRTCQKTTGSAYFPFLAITAKGLNIQGEVRWHEALGDSGHKTNRGFCPTCGATLFGKPAAIPHLRTVSASSLDDPSHFKPEIVVWAENALPWDSTDDTLPTYNKNSPIF